MNIFSFIAVVVALASLPGCAAEVEEVDVGVVEEALVRGTYVGNNSTVDWAYRGYSQSASSRLDGMRCYIKARTATTFNCEGGNFPDPWCTRTNGVNIAPYQVDHCWYDTPIRMRCLMWRSDNGETIEFVYAAPGASSQGQYFYYIWNASGTYQTASCTVWSNGTATLTVP